MPRDKRFGRGTRRIRSISSPRQKQTPDGRKIRTLEEHPRIGERIEDHEAVINAGGESFAPTDIYVPFSHGITVHRQLTESAADALMPAMFSRVRSYFKDARPARMSDGALYLVRDLGPVKGGKGMKHHEVVMPLSVRGLINVVARPAIAGTSVSIASGELAAN